VKNTTLRYLTLKRDCIPFTLPSARLRRRHESERLKKYVPITKRLLHLPLVGMQEQIAALQSQHDDIANRLDLERQGRLDAAKHYAGSLDELRSRYEVDIASGQRSSTQHFPNVLRERHARETRRRPSEELPAQ